MEKLLKEIDSLLASMNVCGDNVLLLATARTKLKEAYDTLPKKEGDQII